MVLNRRGPLAKIVGSSIGMVKEYRADSAERKQASASASYTSQEQELQESGFFATNSTTHLQPPPAQDSRRSSYSDDDAFTDDEEWAQVLDEMADPYTAQPDGRTANQAIEEFLARNPPPPYSRSLASAISMPVIIPQRRPESRHRGFVRAYAPVLQEAGIDETTWLGFLDGFDKSIKANPIFHVLNAGVFVAGHSAQLVAGASLIAFAATTAVHVGIEAGRRGYLHYKQNGYLDLMNDSFFKPRGLYVLIIKYDSKSKPDADLLESIDMESNMVQQISTRDDPTRSKWKNITTPSSGIFSQNDNSIPTTFAPLTFPSLDALSTSQKQSSIKNFGHFASDYFDRRANATYEAENPDLAGGNLLPSGAPRKDFASRYSDPNHDASKGGFVSIASGGRWNPVGPIGKIKERRKGSSSTGEAAGGDGQGNTQGGAGGRPKKKGGMKSMMKQDALYLVVVNLPSEEERRRVAALLEGGTVICIYTFCG